MSEERRQPDARRRRGPHRPQESDRNIRGMIAGIEERLTDAVTPESIAGLNSFERKLIHRHFDNDLDFETRTYRKGETFTLCVYPVGNIEKYAKKRAEESLQSGDSVNLPAMGSYERYIIHNALKDISGIETVSLGEGEERHIQIVSKRFGRGLKRIVKKMRLM